MNEPHNNGFEKLLTVEEVAELLQVPPSWVYERMARRRFQTGSLFQRGKRQKVWVARWWEDVIKPDGSAGRRRRAEVIGRVAELPTRRLALKELSRKLNPINNGSHTPQSTRKIGDFLREDWMPAFASSLPRHAARRGRRSAWNRTGFARPCDA